MRLFSLSCLMVSALSIAAPALAQSKDDSGESSKKKKEEWEIFQAPLAQQKNAGPCPYVKVLYDAARYEEFKDNREASGNVAYTGEIEGVASTCTYKADEPIHVALKMGFSLGRGPQATSSDKIYSYWVAVTQRNEDVIAKQSFSLPVSFTSSSDRVLKTDEVQDIVIPRASTTVNGSSFEILVGFDVTPQMAEFNRLGKRFRIDAGGPTAAAASSGK